LLIALGMNVVPIAASTVLEMEELLKRNPPAFNLSLDRGWVEFRWKERACNSASCWSFAEGAEKLSGTDSSSL
jgi:hypothetical protein